MDIGAMSKLATELGRIEAAIRDEAERLGRSPQARMLNALATSVALAKWGLVGLCNGGME